MKGDLSAGCQRTVWLKTAISTLSGRYGLVSVFLRNKNSILTLTALNTMAYKNLELRSSIKRYISSIQRKKIY